MEIPVFISPPFTHDKMYDLEGLDKESEDVLEYIEASREKAPQFFERFENYQIDMDVVEKISKHSDKYTVVAFSAEWCPDCYKNIPILAKLQEKTGLKTRVFGHLMRDTKSPDKLWASPPSPKQVNDFKVVKIPHIFIFDNDGKKVGEIIENPPEEEPLEESVLNIIEV